MDRAFEWLRMWVCASCSYLASRPATKQKGDMRRGVERGVSISFYIHTHSHEPDKPECQRKAARSVVRPTSLPSSDARATLSHYARWAPCREPRSEARRRRRRRDTTKPTSHANDLLRRTSRRIKRRPDPTSASREPERATAVPSLHFTPTQSGSRCQRKFHSVEVTTNVSFGITSPPPRLAVTSSLRPRCGEVSSP